MDFNSQLRTMRCTTAVSVDALDVDVGMVAFFRCSCVAFSCFRHGMHHSGASCTAVFSLSPQSSSSSDLGPWMCGERDFCSPLTCASPSRERVMTHMIKSRSVGLRLHRFFEAVSLARPSSLLAVSCRIVRSHGSVRIWTDGDRAETVQRRRRQWLTRTVRFNGGRRRTTRRRRRRRSTADHVGYLEAVWRVRWRSLSRLEVKMNGTLAGV